MWQYEMFKVWSHNVQYYTYSLSRIFIEFSRGNYWGPAPHHCHNVSGREDTQPLLELSPYLLPDTPPSCPAWTGLPGRSGASPRRYPPRWGWRLPRISGRYCNACGKIWHIATKWMLMGIIDSTKRVSFASEGGCRFTDPLEPQSILCFWLIVFVTFLSFSFS